MYLPLIEKRLEEILSFSHAGSLLEAARYATLTEGKRLRPQLVLLTSQLYGVPTEDALLPACTIELIHTYSLIHDDLPCMDNDDFRRGKPSLHKAYPEWLALLTGDFLLTYAFELLTETSLPPHQKLALIRTLSQRAGLKGMLGGQELDLSLIGQEISWEILKQLHLNKTAALITASFEFGGILGNSPHQDCLYEIGQLLGLSFQIQDDLEDKDDVAKQKPSVLHTLGEREAFSLAHELCERSLQKLRCLKLPSQALEAFIEEIFCPV